MDRTARVSRRWRPAAGRRAGWPTQAVETTGKIFPKILIFSFTMRSRRLISGLSTPEVRLPRPMGASPDVPRVDPFAAGPPRTGTGRRRLTCPAGRVPQPAGCHPFGTSRPHPADCRREDVEKKSRTRPVCLFRPNSGICHAIPAETPGFPPFPPFSPGARRARHFDRSGSQNRGVEKFFLHSAPVVAPRVEDFSAPRLRRSGRYDGREVRRVEMTGWGCRNPDGRPAGRRKARLQTVLSGIHNRLCRMRRRRCGCCRKFRKRAALAVRRPPLAGRERACMARSAG